MLALVAAVSLAAGPTAREVLLRYECHRCHEVEGVAPPPKAKQCAGCHRELASAGSDPRRLAEGHQRYGEAFERFVRRTATLYVDVPPLRALSRFRASWLRAFLEAPTDLRPHLAESMPRLGLAPEELDALVRGLRLQPDAPLPTPSAARLAEGAALFEARGCVSCHLLGNARFPSAPAALYEFQRPAVSVLARAPDLRHVRERLNRDVLVRLLVDPRAVNPAAQMPRPGLTEAQAALLADFLLAVPLAPPVEPAPTPPPAHEGPVRYEDVEARVFRKVCWHCHSNAELADGDGGPGNTGGFGFKASGLSFASYAEVMNGSLGPDGEYRSIFRPGLSGEPVLLEVLRARQRENVHDFVLPGRDPRGPSAGPPRPSGPRGMPLGLPALSPAELALVEAWVRAGRPAPAAQPTTPAASGAGLPP